MLDKVFQFFKWAKGVYEGSEALKAIYTVFTVVTAVVGVKGFLQARQMLAKGQDIMANKTAAGGKIPVIYGTRRVGAQIVYMDTAQNRSKDLFVVYAISVGECEEILGRTIEIDGNSILDGNIYKGGGYVGSDKISSGSGSLNTASQVGDNQYSNAGTLGTDPTLRYSFVFNLHHGASSQTADPMLRASIPTEWTTNHKLNGICYIAASFDYDKKGMYKGVPQITVQVKGKKVYDPRESDHTFGDPSTYEWSSNPALCFLDYITNDEYGKGLAESQINMTAIGTAADKCNTKVDQPYYNGSYQDVTWSGDEGDDFIVIDDNADWWQNKVDEFIDIRDVNDTSIFSDDITIKGSTRYEFYDSTQENRLYIDGTLSSTYTNEAGSAKAQVKRFHCNGYIDTNKNVMDNAKELLANMRGILNYVNGKYELEIEDTGTSTFSITDDHIIADAGISVDYGNKDKKANKVVIEFFNANKKYELDTATVLHDATPEYYSDDGEVLEIKAEFPYVTDPYIAYNMGKAILTRSRNQTTMQFLGTPEMYKLNVGDIVDLTYSGLGFSGKVCRVEALELQANGLVSVSLIEYFDVYTWEVPAQESVEILAKIPTIGALKPPQASSIVFTDTDASSINRPTLTWTEPTDFPVRQYRVDVVDSSDNNVFSKIVDTPSVDLAFLPKGSNYEASITAFNGVGIESNASTKTFTIADDPVKTTEVEMNGVTLSTVETYGTVTGKTGNWVKFLNKTNFGEVVEFDNGLIVDSGTAQFENAPTFVDGFTGQGTFEISQGSIQFGSYTPATTTNNLYNVGGSLYWNGQALGTGTGDITAVVAGTNLNGGGTSGSVTLNLDSTITGDHTFSNNVIISGDLTVNGTTTTVNTNDLNVKDKNITLNYSTGDSSASANGAGITIQDAVSATQDATLTWNTANDSFNFSHNLNFADNVKAQFGAGNDLRIYHNGTTSNSNIENYTGGLYITNYVDDQDILFRSDDESGGVTTYFQLDGSQGQLKVHKNMVFFDNVKAYFGGGADLGVYHDATDSYIQNSTGSLYINNLSDDKDIFIQSDNGSGGLATYLFADGSEGSLKLFHYGSKKLETTSTGVEITGNLDSPQISINDYISHNGDSNTYFGFDSADTFSLVTGGTTAISADANATYLRYQGSAKLATTSSGIDISGVITTDGLTTSADINFGDDDKALFGAGNDLKIYHSANNQSYIHEVGSGDLNILATNLKLQDAGGSTKVLVNSSGMDVTGTVTSDGMTSSQTINVNSASGSVDARVGFNNSVKNGWIGIPAWDNTSLRIYGTSPTSGNTNEPAAMYKNGAWSFWTDYNNTSGNGSTSTALFISTGGSLNVGRGDIQIGGTTVISSARNLTNIGTINSGNISVGAVNSSQTITTSNAAGFVITNQGKLYSSSNNLYLETFTNGTGIVLNSRTGYLTFKNNGTNKFQITSSDDFNFYSGNLTNIGTISSGSVTAGSSGNSAFLRAYYGSDYMTLQGYGLEMNRTTSYIRPTTDGNKTLYIGGANASLDWAAIHFRSLLGLYMTGTQFLTTDRNLVNIGTISSGAITATGLEIDNEYTLPSASGSAGQVLKYPATGSQVIWADDDTQGTTINNNADNRIITGSGTANTLNAESGLTFDGATLGVVGDISLGDNKKIYLGTGNDTQIYFDGSNSYFLGAGNTFYTGATSIHLASGIGVGSQTYLTADYSNGVKLYHTGAIKAKTTATGFDITGTVTADGLSTSVNTALVGEGASGGSTQLIFWNGTNAYYGRSNLGGSVTTHDFRTGGTTRLTVNSQGIDVTGTANVGKITGTLGQGSQLYGLQLTRSSSGTTTPDLWGDNGTLVLGTSSSTEALSFTGANSTFHGTISSSAITASGLSYLTQVDSSEFRNTTRVSNATTPANTAGWFKIAKVVRGGGRILLSFTGGSYTPDTFVIDYYKNWSTVGSLFLKKYQGTGFITKARIRQDSADSIYYVEIYCASNSNGLSFKVYHQRLQGYASDANTVYGGSLSAGATSGTDIVSEQSFISKGIWTEGIEADYYYGDVNIHSGSLKLNNTTVIDSSRNLTNIGTISSAKLTVNSGADVSQFHSHHTTIHDDWQVSPISIRERGLNTNNSTNNQYSPNLNFHWASVVSRSLTMTSDGNFTLGEWTASGTPSMSSSLSFLNTAGYRVNNTNVIDSSRNLTNIGTISSGVTTITSTGTIGGSTPSNGYLKITDGTNTLAFDANEIHTTDNLYLNAEDGTIYLRGNNGGAVTLKNGGITFMTTTRDLQNIGTISSGAITSTGKIETSGRFVSTAGISRFQGGIALGTDNDVYFYESSAGQATLRTGSSGAYKYFSSRTDGYFLAPNGYMVGSTVIVDGSRNLTNIGTISSSAITANSSGTNTVTIDGTGTKTLRSYHDSGGVGWATGSGTSYTNLLYLDDNNDRIRIYTEQAERLRINASGIDARTGGFRINATTVIDASRQFTTNSRLTFGYNSHYFEAGTNSVSFKSGSGTNYLTINNTGLTTSGSITATGNGVFNFNKTETYNPVITANDSESDSGQIIAVQIGGTTKGNIGISSATGNDMYIASGTTSSAGVGLRFLSYQSAQYASPCRGDGSTLDNVMDLGSIGTRFDDIYATNGTIQTSDRNEKQDIQALTDAEQRVATACKGLIRRFRWQDAVEEKGDDARYHFGVIAQDLQDAFEAEGLDAGDYGMFISSTWTDDDGVEQTRLGVRYNELLAFIISTL